MAGKPVFGRLNRSAVGYLRATVSRPPVPAFEARGGNLEPMDGRSESRACVTVGLPDGLHLRPLTMLAQAAAAFSADISLRRGEQVADAKRPLELMTLVAECGEELWIEARGADAEAAVGRIAALFSTNFAEDAE